MSRLQQSEHPLQVIPDLAVAIGLNEAIVLQQVHYWLGASKHEQEGKKWIPNTIGQWQDQFPFWSKNTIQRTFTSLRDSGLITSKKLAKDASNQTNFYTINYPRLDEVA